MSLLFNPIRLIIFCLLSILMYTSSPSVGLFLAFVSFSFSIIYYYSVLRILFTLDNPETTDDREKVQDMILNCITNIVMVAAVYVLTPFLLVAVWCVPWLVLSLSVRIFNGLIAYEYIEVKYKDDQ